MLVVLEFSAVAARVFCWFELSDSVVTADLLVLLDVELEPDPHINKVMLPNGFDRKSNASATLSSAEV